MAAYTITVILIQSISKHKNSQTDFSGMRVFFVFDIQYGVHIPYIVIYTI